MAKKYNHCKAKLKNIVSSPESAAKYYLAEIDEKLRLMGPLLFTAQDKSVIEAIENTFGVNINAAPPFGIACSEYNYAVQTTTGETAVSIPFNNENGPNGQIISMKVSIDVSIS